MDFAKRADKLGYLPPTLEKRKALPTKGKGKSATVADLSRAQPKPAREVSELKSAVKDLEAQAKEIEKKAQEERKAREQAERILEAERKAREKAEKLAVALMQKLSGAAR